jgi:hypothetical protein
MPLSSDTILQQIDDALEEFNELRKTSKYSDCSDKPDSSVAMVVARLASTLDRLSPKGSYHKNNLEQISARQGHPTNIIALLVGALLALRREYELGHLQSFQELVHADTFAGLIEMADYLQQQGFKDAAAVIAGSVLEQHLRELGIKNQVGIEANGIYKKSEVLNAELCSVGIYNKLDQKNVTSWLGLRNSAAHGNYTNYTQQQARLMIDAIQDFMTRHPA